MKLMKTVIIFFIIGVAIYGGKFAYDNLRGIRPAIKSPAKNIVKEINTTGIPLRIPSGFSISIFASDLQNPRVLRFDPNGVLLVSLPGEGKVIALPDENNDGTADKHVVVVSGLNKPHGIAFHPTTKKLYIAETDAVAMYDYDVKTQTASNRKKIIDLPGGGNHYSRTIGFGLDGKLYIAVGSSCNVCIEKDNRRAKILVANAEGSDLKEYATGLRNSVFFTWHPDTKYMWATEMGRDLIGDDIPPDEVNIIKEGKFYGWPYCYGNNVHDKTFESTTRSEEICTKATPSFIDLQAHSSPLGLVFVPVEFVNPFATANGLTNSLWPQEYQGDLLVAYHGSWNRSVPTGYKVVRIKLNSQGNYEGTEDFITGWFTPARPGLTAAGALGRPVDLLFDQKGYLYISDDKAGVVYRVSPQGFK